MYASGKNASNSDSQNHGQGKDPRIIRGDKIRDPFKERKLSFRIKEKKGEAPLFIISARGACSVELTPSDNLDTALKMIRKLTQVDDISVIGIRSAFTAWQEAETNREQRLERIALIQGTEIELVNLIRASVIKFIKSDMKKSAIEAEIKTDNIELDIIAELQKRIAEKKEAEKKESEK